MLCGAKPGTAGPVRQSQSGWFAFDVDLEVVQECADFSVWCLGYHGHPRVNIC
jgi:hypothetical protein